MYKSLAVVAGATLCLSLSSEVLAQPQGKAQQACINALNKAGAKLSATQGKENAACVKNAGKGNEPDAQACLTADTKQKVMKAGAKVGTADTNKCTVAPSFGRAGVGQITTAATGEELALTSDVFGGDLTAAIVVASSDSAGASCQAAVVKAYEKLAATKVKSFLKCKKVGLKAETITSDAGLEACLTAIAADAKVLTSAAKLSGAVTAKCAGVDLDAAFPGECVGSGDFPGCVDEQVECRVCLQLDAMDNLTLDCDLFDNGSADLSCASLPATTTTTSTTTTTTSTTLPPAPDWGLDCFTTTDCGSSHCPVFGAQCTDYIESVGLLAGSEMCFFDCMDSDLMDVTDCRDDCGGSPPPVCETGVAGAGGFDGVVSGAGKCTPTGFAATVTFGGSSTEFKRVLVDFAAAIDELSLFSAPPPPCSGACPSPGSDCDAGAPYAAAPSADVFRLQIGSAAPAPEVCDRMGVTTSVCKFSATGYAFIVAPPGISATMAAPIDLSLFLSCHVSAGGGATFLHFSTGDFFSVGSWPP